MVFRRLSAGRDEIPRGARRAVNDKAPSTIMEGADLYTMLLHEQLQRYWVTVSGANLAATQNGLSFLYDKLRITLEISDDPHTFMVSSLVYESSHGDDPDEVYNDFVRLERNLAASHSDIRMEFDEDEQVIVFMNVPIDLVQEDCFKEFEEMLDRFLREATKVCTELSSHSQRQEGEEEAGKSAWRRGSSRMMKKIFSGRAA
mmetsp:Transcript_21858/g.50422  ORF Transcript_21858/g.50422 Transcript_21858/m.50422 type:complete len:202 (+) Transcript_21858:140-745(+)|eukprot:CAMPEP_0116844724 /NCGR_PEP_ID=MMETSP0418-20121206/12858_1 /TAXON_ID=1158023 /ORGANISM="Astrosyne radiata, Strain 13vi08-1A" /LENGTH=201 /DNA_ID=CAMNT_0004475731 /DNA_START=107 /DNA_END=712 /DNA_ORIENTATION=+